MSMQRRGLRAPGPSRLRVENHLGAVARAGGLSEAQVADRVAAILGHRPDRRTVRRFLGGAPIADPTLATFLAFCRALDVSVDRALVLRQADEAAEVLQTAGVRFRPRSEDSLPQDWPRVDPAWGDLVDPFLAERHRAFES
ncbi:MAG: hypothetical protein NVSMB17_14470 [Candidatus Dormibacteria bacterium]